MKHRRADPSGLSPDQMTFSFVPAEVRQAMSFLYETHLSKTAETQARRVKRAKKRAALKVVGNMTLDIDWSRYRHLLDLPLLQHEDSDLDVQPDATSTYETADEGETEYHELDDELIARYHEKLLHYSLGVLKSKGNAEEKYEILHWIWSPDIFCWAKRQENGVTTYDPVPRKGLPFTFQTCCALNRLDYDRLRDGLASVLKPTLKAVGLGHFVNN